MFFAKILVEYTPKTCLKKLKTTFWWFFAGPLVGIK